MTETLTEKTAVKLTLRQVVALAISIVTLALYVNGQYSELQYRVETLENNYNEYQVKQVPMMLYNIEAMSKDIQSIKEYIIPKAQSPLSN